MQKPLLANSTMWETSDPFYSLPYIFIKSKDIMPNVAREDISSQSAVLKVVIERGDYEPKFNDELKKVKNQASLKGFRKGKTPIGFLKKMYGKKMLADIVTDILQEELGKEVNGENSDYLGRPIPPKDQPRVDFDPNNLEDYEFKFEIGMAPDFEVQGADDSTVCEFYKVTVPEEKIDEQVDLLKRQKGERVEVEDGIKEEDVISLKAKELENGEIKESGWETTFSVITTRMEDDIREEILTKKKGDTLRFNIYKLEKDATPEFVKKYLLNFTEADIEEGTETNEEYEATIEEVKRLVPAELTQEVLEEVLGEEGEKATEEELRSRIRSNIGSTDVSTANTILYRDLKDKLLALNKPNMPLPEEYLKRWVEVGFEKERESILNNFEDFADDMRWTLIKNKLYKKYDFKIEEEEIRQAAESRIMGYFGGQFYPGMEDMIKNLVDKTMENREEVERLATDVLSNKLFFELKNAVTLKEVEVTSEELAEKMKAIEAENQAISAKWAGGSTDEEE
ncbi:MAG: trigger factor [Saprospiraceae bacterium]